MRLPLIAMSLALIVSACGPAYHLRRAAHHIDKAKQKGAEISRDTVTVHDTTVVKSHTVDTVFQNVNFQDTLIVEDVRTITKVKVDYVDRKVYVKTFVKPNTIIKRVQVPYEKIKAPTPWYRDPWILAILALIAIILWLVRRLFR